MKKSIKIFVVFLFCFFSIPSFAYDTSLDKIAVNTVDEINEITVTQENVYLTRADVLHYMAYLFWEQVLPSYQYIHLYFTDVEEGTSLYKTLQKLVYLDLIKNAPGKIYPDKNISAYSLYAYFKDIFDISFTNFENSDELKKRKATLSDLKKITNNLAELIEEEEIFSPQEMSEVKNSAIFIDVYNTLTNYHYDKESLDEEQMIYKAIEWLTEGTWDKYTSYFPPMENESFQDGLSWKYEWIGAYVDMEMPWAVRIISPLPWSPAEKAWLKWGDMIIKVDGRKIEDNNSLYEVISWIKGPAGTPVMLTVIRGEEELGIEVIRDKIIIKEVESEIINNTTSYIRIKQFWDTVFEDFRSAIDEIKENKDIKNIVIDLRNNPWGYLDEVNAMLSLFIEKWNPVSVVKYTDFTINNKSRGYEWLNLSEYNVVLLQNSWTASASEIMIGTLKDYFPKIIVIWETSYWKGSVQSLKSYNDGSSLKFTVAKWFTGKTSIAIDSIGIVPDKEILLNEEEYQEGKDNQLEAALEIFK